MLLKVYGCNNLIDNEIIEQEQIRILYDKFFHWLSYAELIASLVSIETDPAACESMNQHLDRNQIT